VSPAVWFGIAGLGGVGALLRFRLDDVVQRRVASDLPLGTLAVNLGGTFVLGLLNGLSVAGDSLLLVGTGLLGSLTTFSTLMLETERLAEDGDGRLAVVNVALSLGGGLVAAVLGWALGAVL
jgi:CrcB protein